ncbi:hypothetical protein AAG570_003811 [Ranatra chinensis]|uniref:CCHC-type domain-containing protein n=1 Tax=Ranatra chinensis TaxID=642074 RepID=A0ABD0YJ39_9HEMI
MITGWGKRDINPNTLVERFRRGEGPVAATPPLALGRQGTRAGRGGGGVGRTGFSKERDLVGRTRPTEERFCASFEFFFGVLLSRASEVAGVWGLSGEKEVVRLHRGPCLHHPSTLEPVLANSAKCISSITTLTEGGSDHLPVYFELWGTPQKQLKELRLDFRKTDWDVFRCELNNVILTAKPPLGTATEINPAMVNYTEEITAACRASTHVITPKPQKLGFPEEIIKLIRDKNKNFGMEDKSINRTKEMETLQEVAAAAASSAIQSVAKFDSVNVEIAMLMNIIEGIPVFDGHSVELQEFAFLLIAANEQLVLVRPTLGEDIRKVVKEKFRITNRGRTTQILTSNEEDFAALKGLFRLRELEFHTFALQSEHRKRFFIHGLTEGFTAEEVEEELKAALPPVVRVVQMEKREGGKIPVFIVMNRQEVTINYIKGVGDISLHTFRVKIYKSGDTPPQCFRCQQYGHTSRYCNLKEVCVKCSNNHHTKDCKEGAQVKSANFQKERVVRSQDSLPGEKEFGLYRATYHSGTSDPKETIERGTACSHSCSQALGNQQESNQIGSNIVTRQTGNNTASITNIMSEMKLLDGEIKELNIYLC